MLATTPGLWLGTKQLWFEPTAPVIACEARAAVNLSAGGGYLTIAYEWEYKGKPQDGLLSVRLRTDDTPVAMTWVDSFHQAKDWLLLVPTAMADDAVAALGHYAAPTGPDWGWSIEVAASSEDTLVVTMHNIMPEHEPMLAVRIQMERQ